MEFASGMFSENTVFLVTGGAGFIGSHLCEYILNMGCKVLCLDDMSTGKTENVDMFINNPNYRFIYGDIGDYIVCNMACESVDYVLHHAAAASVPGSIDNPLLYNRSNIQGFVNILEAAKNNNVKRVVYASSSAVYGDNPKQPKKENMTGALLSPYALSKLCNEEWAKQYTMHYGISTCGLRYFNVFGPKQDSNGAYAAVIPKFIQAMLNGDQPIIYGDGSQSRDFTYVKNVVEANMKACFSGEEVSGEVFNIASGISLTILEIYEMIARYFTKKIEPKFEKTRKGDILCSSANIEKARVLLGYAPQYDFEEGLKESFDWYRADFERRN